LINGTDTNFIVLNDLIIDNNTILNTHLSHLKVASQVGNITISNNFFGSKRDFLEDATPTRASLIQPSAPGDINIKGNTFNADHINQYIVALEQGKNVFLCDNLAVINTPSSTVGNKTFIENISATLLKKMEITNNSITLIDAGTDPLYIFRSAGGYTGELLTISNNNADGPEAVEIFDPTNLGSIIFDNFRMKNNSWIVNIQYVSSLSNDDNIVLKPGYYELILIIYISSQFMDPPEDVKITLPSTFLQDGQQVTIAVSEFGIGLDDPITILGGTVIGAPDVLLDRSSFTLKYRKSDDKWYLVN
jgi:hypothetical protein